MIRTFAGLRPEPTGGDFIIKAEEEVWGFINVAGIRSPGLTSAPAIAYEVRDIIQRDLGINLVEKEKWNPYRKDITHFFMLPPEKANELIKKNPSYGKIVCRCNHVSEGDILEAIERMKFIGVKTPSVDSVKFRTKATTGTCQGSFCRPKIVQLLAREYGVEPWEVTLKGRGSEIGIGDVKALLRGGSMMEPMPQIPMLSYDVVVIGGGPAGMAAAAKAKELGLNVLLLDENDYLGGILPQCIHPGFGLHYFKEELTGPEFASRLAKRLVELGVEYRTAARVLEIKNYSDLEKVVIFTSPAGVYQVWAKAIIYAAGARERHAFEIGIVGDRVAGIYTAGEAQTLMDIYGVLPGKEVVIVGSGDVGLIMARRFALEGAKVKAVVELMPYPGGLARNVMILRDFNIPSI